MRFVEYLNYTNSSRRITESSSRKVQPKTKKELIQVIKDTIEKEGYDCDLNFIDTSKITDMAELFYVDVLNKFNEDISNWDVSNVKAMTSMFRDSKFKKDISKWNVSNVEEMNNMFNGSPLENTEPD